MRSAWTSTGATNFCRSTWRWTVRYVQLQTYFVDATTLDTIGPQPCVLKPALQEAHGIS